MMPSAKKEWPDREVCTAPYYNSAVLVTGHSGSDNQSKRSGIRNKNRSII